MASVLTCIWAGILTSILTSILTGVLTGVWASVWGGHAEAADRPHAKRLLGHPAHMPKARGDRPRASGHGEATHCEHVQKKVPFGSKCWWDISEEQQGTPGPRSS